MIDNIISFKKNKSEEGPVETGTEFGMSISGVIDKYLKKPNDVIKLLRIYSKLSIEELSKQTELSIEQLKNFEDTKIQIPYQFLPSLAKAFNVNLKLLLYCFGYVKEEEVDSSKQHNCKLSMAAQYSGPELSKQEKVDLEQLFKLILSKKK
jgi:hypothetical protein